MLLELDGEFKIRIGMMNPMYIPQLLSPLLDILLHESKVLKFLHIPMHKAVAIEYCERCEEAILR